MSENHASNHAQHRNIVYKLYVFLIAYITVAGWALSGIHELRWIGIFSLLGLAVTIVLAKRWMPPESRFWQSLAEPFGWPFLLIAGLGLFGQMLYQPVMLDSLTYRLPSLFIWLQNDSLQHVAISDARINYMSQTWGIITLPLVQLAGDQMVWCWSFASWIVLYLVTYDWAFELNGDVKKSRVLAFLASTSTIAIMQGSSSANDIFAATALLLALKFAINFERTRNWREINWSVLAFCIAGGTKPHYAVFGLPMVLWFFLSPSKPWKAFRWAWLPLLLVVWFLCSPAPSFVMNTQTYHTWAGPGQDVSLKGKSPAWNVALGSVMVAWQNIQPSVNPAALVYGKQWNSAVEKMDLTQYVPRFNFGINPLVSVDGAAFGLLTSILLIVGIVIAFRRQPDLKRSWQTLAMAAGFLCTLIALSRFVSGASGRAYCGFLFTLFPLAIAGWNFLRPATLKGIFYVNLAASLLTVIVYPSHPLWPAHEVLKQCEEHHLVRLGDSLKTYIQYSERAVTAEDIVATVPSSEKIIILAGEDRPLLPLFRPYSQHRILLFLAPHVEPKELLQMDSRYVLVGGGAEDQYPELCKFLSESMDYEMIIQKDYTSKIARGPEPWKLYRRVGK